MNIDKLIEGVEVRVITSSAAFILKKIFLNDKAKAFYRRTWEFLQIVFMLLMGGIVLFFVSKSKLPANTKLGISIAILFGMVLLVFLSKAKVSEVKTVRD